MKSFLGAIQYLAKFLPRLSGKTDSLRKLLKKNTNRVWDEEKTRVFEAINRISTEDHCLAHYAKDRDNIVTTDANTTELGITLWQKQTDNELKPIAFASRYLNDTEKNYSIGELELLAVVWGWKNFDCIFMGGKYFYSRTTKH